MKWIAITGIFFAIAILLFILRSRGRSIVAIDRERKYFQKLAGALGLQFLTDDYFAQIEGTWHGFPVIILPYHFEGPGSVTLIYLQTKIPSVERNWIEPNMGLGRALVESRRNATYGYEISGKDLSAEKILEQMKQISYPYVAVTLPSRFSYSSLLQQSVQSWKNFIVLIALDEGRKPSTEKIISALEDAEKIAIRVSLQDT